MLNRDTIFNNEKIFIENFFNKKFDGMPGLPDWVNDDLINFWHKNLFNIHYVPKFIVAENLQLNSWKQKPSKIFYKKIRKAKLEYQAQILPGKWLLIDGRDKPKKKVPWIRINDIWLLEKFGLKPKDYLKKWGKQLHQDEYLIDILNKKGFGSRFCLNIQEINNLKPHILYFLKIESKKNIRLPFFIEYNYFGNAFYKQWKTTETWEWFEDKLSDGQHLAGGSNSVACLGWDPVNFWSTILTFRPVIEL